ncbi:MAG: hypothetical protein JNN20_03560 [Betaproteobacteria bacterium]|nr:hypothetical protein [Betaproteobacteria bacterium]
MTPTSTRTLPLLFPLLLAACATTPEPAPREVAVAAAVMPTTNPRNRPPRVAFLPQGDFSERAVRRGVSASADDCRAVENAVWVESPHGNECIRYWAAGFGNASAKRAVIFFHGDVLANGGVSADYQAMTPEKLQRDANQWATRLGVPYIFVGRPGTNGSSGEHTQRRRISESVLMSMAVDAIKKRHGIEELVLAGQSGGGHVTASLLAARNDIVCAVPTSSVSSPRLRQTMRKWTVDATGYDDSYEPVEHLDKSRMNAKLRVFVVGDPQDSNVLWAPQTILAKRLTEIGVANEILEGEGTGPARHGMARSARIVAGWCANDVSTAEIVQRAKAGLKG